MQCGRYHRLHSPDALYGVIVTEDTELFHACVSHKHRNGCNLFREKLTKAGVQMHKFVHIEKVLINDGGVNADTTAG